MSKPREVTARISKKFNLSEIELVVEALSVYRDSHRRMVSGLFDKKGRMYTNSRKELMSSQELIELMSGGEVEMRSVSRGPLFSPEECDHVDGLIEAFLAGMVMIEDKIDTNINKKAEENIDKVITDLYSMLKGEE